MHIVFYINQSDRNVINKVLTKINLTSPPTPPEYFELEGDIKQDVDIKRGSIEIDATRIYRLLAGDIGRYFLKSCNYCYIEEFSRYYYITSITLKENKILEIDYEEDVLYTYKDEIANSRCHVIANEFNYNKDINNGMRTTEDGGYMITISGTQPIANGDNRILLTAGPTAI